ncbi:MAG: hypothetical protein ACKVOM_06235 [Ferruginibacter sp.]
MKAILLFSFFATAFFDATAFSDTTNIPIGRKSRHDDIRNEQISVDKMDGKFDGLLKASNDENINNQVTDALYRKPNELRQFIEANDIQLPTNNDKVRFLRSITEVLTYFRIARKEGDVKMTDLPLLLTVFEEAMKAKVDGKTILPILETTTYGIAKIVTRIFAEDAEQDRANAIVYVKYVNLHPDKILQTIAPYANEDFADSLVIVACKLDPVQFYNYAQSDASIVGKLIHRNRNKMVMQVAALSKTENALFYFPFLDDLLSERQSIDSIKKYVGDGDTGYDSIAYYKLLVSTATAYSKRMAKPFFDTAIAYYGPNGLLKTLHNKALQHFISPINNLHEENNLAVRMRAIQPLAAADIYYMMVMGENDIYTSSYKHSFNRLLQVMGQKPKGDSLLVSVNFNQFRKFIKMAANYNQLDTFLKTMPLERSEILMKAFVSQLDNNLEDAVDVADSYSSISNKKLQQTMLQNVTDNENVAIQTNNTKAKVIYGLLKTIFLSLDDNSVDLSAQIGIPPIYEVGNKYIRDAQANIVEQVFFYGDKDGKMFYPPFKNSFSAKDWNVTETKEWMKAASIKGNVIVFANKPLDNDANLDDSAQIHLGKYLEENNMKPSVIVHRGHSYWLDRTMTRMPGDAKIVVLGSCGGYQNLNEILEINPEAHIISTKEIGTGDINRPILTYINEKFASGDNLSWPKMWQYLSAVFLRDPNKNVKESWDDYIPPYKNLGAIFLKAYSKKMETE